MEGESRKACEVASWRVWGVPTTTGVDGDGPYYNSFVPQARNHFFESHITHDPNIPHTTPEFVIFLYIRGFSGGSLIEGGS